ncbi:hypothetical protein [Saccharopolyspora gregorii]|uniref:Uncharacterized protein n=1 Tax=Saccharopolyspora gregorii TaxID=33914 RepID=A0ABP6RJ66_9PSEU
MGVHHDGRDRGCLGVQPGDDAAVRQAAYGYREEQRRNERRAEDEDCGSDGRRASTDRGEQDGSRQDDEDRSPGEDEQRAEDQRREQDRRREQDEQQD